MNIIELDQALKAVAPVLGVSVGKMDDNSTWEINFAKEATDEQKAAAQAILESAGAVIDPITPPKALTADSLAAVLVAEGIISADKVEKAKK